MSKLYRSIGIALGLVLVVGAASSTYFFKISFGKDNVNAQTNDADTEPAYEYDFSGTTIISEASSAAKSESQDWWVESGGELKINNGVGDTLEGSLSSSDSLRKKYAESTPIASDNGYHPQNVFRVMTEKQWQDSEQTMYVDVLASNLFNPENSNPWNGLSLVARYQDDKDYYYLGVRMDGEAVIKKKVNGTYYTLNAKKLWSGSYDPKLNPDLIPSNKKIGLRSRVVNNPDGSVLLQFYVDQTGNGSWKLAAEATDNGKVGGAPIAKSGRGGIITDYMDVQFSNYSVSVPAASSDPSADSGSSTQNTKNTKSAKTSGDSSDPSDPTDTPSDPPVTKSAPASSGSSSSYDSVVLSDKPAMLLDMDTPGSGSETDKSGHGNSGTYKGSDPSTAKLPNGDFAAVFNGSSQYLTVPSDSSLSIPTTHELTWEAWIKPDSFNFSNASDDGYVDWMGKCQDYSPTCEWEARLYGNSTPEGRPDRLSAYVFNPTAGLGSGADWQPNSDLGAGKWIYVVAEYDMDSTPSGCSSSDPGTINIWVDGVKQDFGSHAPTGCMSQYNVKPKAGSSPLDIGTMAMDTWFKGAIGKVAVYDHLLSADEIASHYKAMTGSNPSGSCKDTCTAKGM